MRRSTLPWFAAGLLAGMFSITTASADSWALRGVDISPDMMDALDVEANSTFQDGANDVGAMKTSSIIPTTIAPIASQAKVVIVKQKLRDLLRVAASRNQLDVELSRGVRGYVEARTLPSNLDEMLQALEQSHKLVWYRKNKTLNISTTEETKSRLIFLGDTSFKRFKKSLTEAGIEATSFQFEYLTDAQSVSVNGPISFLANLELIAEALSKSKGAESIVTIKAGVINKVRR